MTTIRTETPADHASVFALIKAAFANEAFTDHQEQFLVERLRQSDAFVPGLSLVAVQENQVVGHILLTRLTIQSGEEAFPSLALAPVSVLPEFQGRGIGGRLIRQAHTKAVELGFKSAVLLGHSDYYPRFGYRKASEFGISFPFDAPDENCMAMELVPGGLDQVAGKVVYPSVWGIE